MERVRILAVLLAAACHVICQENIGMVIIDVQNCFTKGGSLPVPEGEQVIDVINRLRFEYGQYFKVVAQTQDWHCADHVSFASQHNGYNIFQNIFLTYSPEGSLCRTATITGSYAIDCAETKYNISQSLWPDHCIIDTEDAKFHPRLTIEASDIIVQKGYHCQVDSYSGFYDNGGFGQTELQAVLKNAGVKTVFITGLALDFCVYFTSMDAKKIGFKTYVVLDATRAVDKEGGEWAIADMVANDIMVINSDEVGEILKQLSGAAVHLVTPPASFIIVSLLVSTLSAYKP